MRARFDKKLQERYDKKHFGIRTGDTVEIMRGDFKGQSGKVNEIKGEKAVIEGITVKKADGSATPKGINISNVRITKIDLSDSWRMDKLEEKGGE